MNLTRFGLELSRIAVEIYLRDIEQKTSMIFRFSINKTG